METAFIPTLDSVSHYIEPTFAGKVTMSKMFDFAMANKINVFMEGEAGSGKTSGVIWYAAQRNLPIFIIPSNQALDLTQLLGGLYPNAEGKLEWVDGAITRLVRGGGILYADEVNTAHKSLSQYLMSLADDRRSITLMSHENEVIRAHENFLFVAGGNPLSYRYTQPMNEAWKDRFGIKVELGYSREIESKLLASSDLLDLLYGMRSTSRIESQPINNGTIFETPISTRLGLMFEKVALGLGYDFAVESFVNNFTLEERPAVRMLLEGATYGIKEQLGIPQEVITTEHATI